MRGYITAGEVAALLGWDAEDASLLTEIGLYLALGEQLVEQFCKSRFDRETGVTKTFRGNGTDMLVHGHFLRSVTSVVGVDIEGSEIEDVTAYITQGPDEPQHGAYRWIDRVDGLKFKESLWYRITGNWGWEDEERPPQIRTAVAWTIKFMFDIRKIDEFILSESGGGRHIQMREDIDLEKFVPFSARAVLKDFINRRMFGT